MAPSTRARVGLTRAGVVCVVAAIAAIGASRVAAIEELSITGLSMLALVVCSLVVVRVGGRGIEVNRTIRPRRLMAGDSCRVSVQIHNASKVARLPLVIEDRLDGVIVAETALAQGRGNPSCVADYGVLTRRRGIARFGPLTVRITDPFGLARISHRFAANIDVIVLPRLTPLGVEAAEMSDDPAGAMLHRRAISTLSEEFDALREYVPGDDVRRVHWASTARFGRPMVRNHQQPSQRRSTVVLDTRAGAHGDEGSFERAVTVAASALAACRAEGDVVRLVTTDGLDTGRFDSTQVLNAVLDQLATITTVATGNLPNALGAANSASGGDRMVVCAGAVSDTDRGSIISAGSRGGELIVVACGPSMVVGAERPVFVVEYHDGDVLDAKWRAAHRARESAHVGHPWVATNS